MRASLSLLGIYLGLVLVLQAVSIATSQLVGLVAPMASLFVFLALYFLMFVIAWPIALRLSYRFVPETEEERVEQNRKAPTTTGRMAPAPRGTDAFTEARA